MGKHRRQTPESRWSTGTAPGPGHVGNIKATDTRHMCWQDTLSATRYMQERENPFGHARTPLQLPKDGTGFKHPTRLTGLLQLIIWHMLVRMSSGHLESWTVLALGCTQTSGPCPRHPRPPVCPGHLVLDGEEN